MRRSLRTEFCVTRRLRTAIFCSACEYAPQCDFDKTSIKRNKSKGTRMRLRHTQFAWGRFLIWGHLPYLEHLEHLCGFYRSFSFKCQCPRRLTILTMLDLWGARVAGARCNSTLIRAARARAIADGSREPEYAPPTNRPLHLPRAPHTIAFANAGAMQVTPSWRNVTPPRHC